MVFVLFWFLAFDFGFGIVCFYFFLNPLPLLLQHHYAKFNIIHTNFIYGAKYIYIAHTQIFSYTYIPHTTHIFFIYILPSADTHILTHTKIHPKARVRNAL